MSKRDQHIIIYGQPTATQRGILTSPVKLFKIQELPHEMSQSPANKNIKVQLRDAVRYTYDATHVDALKAQQADSDILDTFIRLYERLTNKQLPLRTIEYLDRVMQDAAIIILKEKYKWNVPRPFQLRPIAVKYVSLTADTPSYPSGHSAQSRILAHLFAQLDPAHRVDYFSHAQDIGVGRIKIGVHYPMDHEYGMRIGDILWRGLA